MPHGWGRLSGREMSRQFWMGTMQGCYIGHGETYTNTEEVLWWSKGGRLVGESPARIAWLRRQMEAAPPFDELMPMGDAHGRFVLGTTGRWYMVFCPTADPVTVNLAPPGPYEMEWLDTWAMRATPVGGVPAGPFTIAPPAEDSAFRFRALPPGATGVPPFRVIASAYDGPAPLVVRFRMEPSASGIRWDFGDGTTSDQAEPEHEFRSRGRYTIIARTPTAAAWTFVQVDSHPGEPSLRAQEETPPVPQRQRP